MESEYYGVDLISSSGMEEAVNGDNVDENGRTGGQGNSEVDAPILLFGDGEVENNMEKIRVEDFEGKTKARWRCLSCDRVCRDKKDGARHQKIHQRPSDTRTQDTSLEEDVST